MNLDETIKEAKITSVLYENEARKCIQHGGSFYEEKAKAFRESAKEFEQVVDWLEELKTYRVAERPRGEWIPMRVSSGRDSWKCSICGRRARGKLENLPYCHCGARMRGADDENN